MGSKGDSYDNALAETINGLYKAELIHRRAPWKTKEAVELATLEWVSWFNHHRLLEPIGYIPPAEAEANYYRQLASQATRRPDLNQMASTKPGAIQTAIAVCFHSPNSCIEADTVIAIGEVACLHFLRSSLASRRPATRRSGG